MLDSLLELLQRERLLAAGVCDRMDRSGRAGERRDARHARYERGLADEIAIRARTRALRGVDDEVATTAADEIAHRRACALLRHLPPASHVEPCRGERVGGAGGRQQLEPEVGEPAR